MLDDIKKFATIIEGKEQELTSYLEGLKKPTSEGVKPFLDTEEGKKIIQPILDKYHAKGLETWKSNNLQKLIDDEIIKKFPNETEDQKQLRQLKADLENEKKARITESMKNKALGIVTQKGLPLDLVDYFVGQDEDSTIANLAKLESVWQVTLQKAVEDKFKEGGRDPHKGKQTTKTTLEQLEEQFSKAISTEEKVKLKRKITELQKE